MVMLRSDSIAPIIEKQLSPIEIVVSLEDIERMRDGIRIAYGMEATDDFCRDLLTFVEALTREPQRD